MTTTATTNNLFVLTIPHWFLDLSVVMISFRDRHLVRI